MTLAGMVATDLHGKNHHKDGRLKDYVDWLDIIRSDGNIQRYSREKNPELFNWTIGGIDLTGIILNIALRLRPISTSSIKQKTISTNNITHYRDTLTNTGCGLLCNVD